MFAVGVAAERLEIESYKDIEKLFEDKEYTYETWQAGIREVPRLYITTIPSRRITLMIWPPFTRGASGRGAAPGALGPPAPVSAAGPGHVVVRGGAAALPATGAPLGMARGCVPPFFTSP